MEDTQVQLEEKLRQRIDRNLQSKVNPALRRVQDDGSLMNDYIVTLGKNRGIDFLPSEEVVKMRVQSLESEAKEFSLHSNAVYQLADRFNISSKDMRRYAESKEGWQIELASHVLNEHTQHTARQRLLVREVGNEVRGVLSDKYKRLSTPLIYKSFINACQNVDMQFYDAYADDLRSYVEAVNPNIFQIPVRDKTIAVALGARIRSSDFGCSSLEMSLFHVHVWCLNGMTRETILREVHLGGKLPDNLEISEKTYRLDSETKASLVSDGIKSMLTREAIEKEIALITRSTEMEVNLDTEFTKLQKVGMLKGEIDLCKELMMAGRQSDGLIGEGNTLFKLTQGVSAAGRNLEEANKITGQRKRELEDIAGTLFNRVKLN
jgi:hypothetical protein